MALIKGLSVGFVIVCPSGVLVGHTTGSDHWDVPKGRLDPGEEPLEGAKRELTEETGLSWVDVRRGSVGELQQTELVCKFSGARYPIVKFRDLGQHEYTKRKDLHLFELTLAADINANALKCESLVDRGSYSFPELDRFTLVTSNLSKHLTPNLYLWLKAHM